jgi:hypothetical protein
MTKREEIIIFFRKCSELVRLNFRLVEAVGMATVLICWALDWNSVQYWDSAKKGFKDNLQSAQFAYAESHRSADARLESAITRALNIRGAGDLFSNKKKLDKIYESAWDSNEVRQRWHVRVSDNIIAADNYLMIARSYNKDYNLNLDKSIKETSDNIEHTIKLLGEEYFKSPPGTITVIPNAKRISAKMAGEFDSISYDLIKSTVTLSNQTAGALYYKGDRASSIYRFTFLLGTALLIIAKLYEWRISLPKKDGGGSA